jgi:multimeric flavodoxin WrbA
MRVFGICGSPRVGGNSEWALVQVLDECAKNGFQTKKVLLSEANIKLCDGSFPEELEKNPIDDDMKYIMKEMIAADILIFSTPTYFDNVTPHLKNFIDRTDPFYKQLEGKKSLIIAVGQADEDSWMGAVNYLKLYCEIANVSVKGSAAFKAVHKGDLKETADADKNIRLLVNKIQ